MARITIVVTGGHAEIDTRNAAKVDVVTACKALLDYTMKEASLPHDYVARKLMGSDAVRR